MPEFEAAGAGLGQWLAEPRIASLPTPSAFFRRAWLGIQAVYKNSYAREQAAAAERAARRVIALSA